MASPQQRDIRRQEHRDNNEKDIGPEDPTTIFVTTRDKLSRQSNVRNTDRGSSQVAYETKRTMDHEHVENNVQMYVRSP